MDKTKDNTRVAVLSESLFLEGQVDDERMAIKGVTLIKAGFSSNSDKGRKRYYPAEVLKNSIQAFEGAIVHVNHPGRKESENLPEGDALGVRGWYENVRWDNDSQSLKGDQVLVDRESTRKELWPIIKAAVSQKPDLVELSINAGGRVNASKVGEVDAAVVEAIFKGDKPNRVDIVTAGAAGGSYKNALMASATDDLTDLLLKEMSFEQWRESNPEFMERLKNEMKTARDTEALRESTTKNEDLTKEITRLKEELQANATALGSYRRAELADRILFDSALPARIKQEVRKELLEADGEESMKKIIMREQTKYKESPKPEVHISGNGTRTNDKPAQTTAPANQFLESTFGLRSSADVPHDGETPEQWAARTNRNYGA